MRIELEHFPALPIGTQRTIAVRGLDADQTITLQERGYTVIEVSTLPQQDDDDRRAYLRLLARGYTECTIPHSAADRAALQMEMRSLGMLDKILPMIPVKPSNTVESLLDWGQDRYSLSDGSTMVGAAKLREKSKKVGD